MVSIISNCGFHRCVIILAFLALLDTQIQISFHIADHQDHLNQKGHLFPKTNLIDWQQDITNFSRKEQNKQSSRKTSDTFSNKVEVFRLESMRVAVIGCNHKRNNQKEVRLGLDCLVTEEEPEDGNSEYACKDNGVLVFEIHFD